MLYLKDNTTNNTIHLIRMAAINDLISQIENPELRSRIQAELDRMNKQKKFGLVFEEHLPESVKLYDVPVKKNSVVMEKAGGNAVYKVISINEGIAECIDTTSQEPKTFNIAELVSIAQFGTPIYPYLKPIDSICNAPDSDLWHTLIEADNYHALQLLEYLYAGKVDCIYIDPPYNTGARDWKYNNDYVDSVDEYRHSKWLSFMKKRLLLAKKLLKPTTGVLICTIDDNELYSLGLLLEQVFTDKTTTPVAIVHNPSGTQGINFSVNNEFALFVYNNSIVTILPEVRTDETADVRSFMNGAKGNTDNYKRITGYNCFYPILIKDGEVVGFGAVVDKNEHPDGPNVPLSDGVIAVFPIDGDGEERKWLFARDSVETVRSELVVKYDKRKGLYSIIRVKNQINYKTIWTDKSYNAKMYGTMLLGGILPGRKFPFPKSVYAVLECLKTNVRNNPNALIIDFFAGSGTTLHAVNLLNAEDGGHRRCIMVTNNEVSVEEAKSLALAGFQPGDDEWEKLGIARYVNWPRSKCSIKGVDINGNPLKGNYLGINRPLSEGFNANAIFFKLGFLNKNSVALGRQFRELLPVLWMKAGAIGKCPELESDNLPDWLIFPENKMAVLINDNQYLAFKEGMEKVSGIETLYIITDFEREYAIMANELGIPNTFQLYRDYLDNFRINHSR